MIEEIKRRKKLSTFCCRYPNCMRGHSRIYRNICKRETFLNYKCNNKWIFVNYFCPSTLLAFITYQQEHIYLQIYNIWYRKSRYWYWLHKETIFKEPLKFLITHWRQKYIEIEALTSVHPKLTNKTQVQGWLLLNDNVLVTIRGKQEVQLLWIWMVSRIYHIVNYLTTKLLYLIRTIILLYETLIAFCSNLTMYKSDNWFEMKTKYDFTTQLT